MKQHSAPVCPYCGQESWLMSDEELYGRRFKGTNFWVCVKCDAHVGTHPNSGDKPLGRLATKELRRMKIEAHASFDQVWRAAMKLRGWSKSKARGAAYRWLAKQMGISEELCHIGYFDEQETAKVIEICRSIPRTGRVQG